MSPKQAEIPGTASPDRDDELHALWLEVVDCQETTAAAKAKEKAKKEEASAALHKKGIRDYKVDGANLWLEGKETVKAKKAGARPRGKVKKVVAGAQE